MRRPFLDLLLTDGSLRAVFQPIFEFAGNWFRVHALECLARGPAGTALEPAHALFESARRLGEEPLVDRLCIERAFREAARLPSACALNVNVHASTLSSDPDLLRFMQGAARTLRIDLRRIVVEVVEQSPSLDRGAFERALCGLRGAGMEIAVDDLGTGQSNYRMILDCRPHYLKVDRYVVAGVDHDPARQAIIRSIVDLGRSLPARVVAEGVETLAELTTVRKLGVDLVQGYFLSRPREAASFTRAELRRRDRLFRLPDAESSVGGAERRG